jgi:hypothetical protein
MRLDLLVFIMIERIVPHYTHKVDLINEPSGRARDRASWRDEMKEEWRNCEKKNISDPDEFPALKYAPDPRAWLCGCPAFVNSRFLFCKHLIQLCKPVPPEFFLQAKRSRTLPFWSHSTLQPITPLPSDQSTLIPSIKPLEIGFSRLDHGNFDDLPSAELRANFAVEMKAMADACIDVSDFIKHQIQFGEVRFLTSIRPKINGLLKFHDEVKEFERVMNGQHEKRPKTWDRRNMMFGYSRSRDI